MKSEIQNPKSDITILLVDDTKELNDSSARVLRSVGAGTCFYLSIPYNKVSEISQSNIVEKN